VYTSSIKTHTAGAFLRGRKRERRRERRRERKRGGGSRHCYTHV